MSRVLTNEQNYYDIADTIRQMKNVNTTYKPREMASALKDIYSNEVEGTLPLSFEANGNNLLNYRIDGASGGVGDRTSNLVDYSTVTRGYRIMWASGTSVADNSAIMSDFIAVSNGIYRASASFNLIGYDINKNYIGTYDPYSKMFKKDYSSKTTYYDIADNNVKFVKLLSYSATDTISQDTMFCNSTTIPEYEPYGYKVPVVVNGKNLFDETQVPDKSASTETSNYQIFKQNGKLIVNGITTSSQVDTEISKENGVNNQALDFINNNAGNYIFTSSVPGRIMIRYKQNGSDVVRYTFNEYNSTNKIADRIVFRLQQNYQYDNETMNIMFKLNKIQSTNYEPYIEPTTTNIYLDEPIEANESISLSDTEVDIPTIDGTNILTINTTVQPSNVYIQAPKDAYPKDIVNTKFAMSTFTTIPNTIQNLNWHKVVDMSYMFAGCSNLTIVPVLDTSKATNMCYMFIQCSNLTTIPLLDTSNVENMEGMFSDCANLTTIPLLDTSNVENMKGMFSDCANLTTIPLLDTGKVERTREMFSGCVNLTTIPLIDTGNVFDAFHMFYGCVNLTTIPLLDLSNLSTEYMFSNCPSLSNESLNNILLMCTTATKMYIKTLKIMGLTSSQATICESLSNYQAFINAGWTTGY